MKRKILALFICSHLIYIAHSQEKVELETPKLLVGVTNGATINKLRSNDDILSMYKMKISYIGGISARYKILPFLGVKTGLIYENKGSKIDFSYFGYSFSGKINMNTINLPLSAYYEHQIGPVNVFVGLGGNFNFLLSANYKSGGQSESGTDGMNRVDVGLNGELGASYSFMKMFTAEVSFRESYGLLNIDSSSGSSVKSNSMGLLFSVYYHLK